MMKDMEDPDPTIREFAARTLSSFGPPAQKGDVSKLLLRRMAAERDPSVRFAVFGAVGAIAFDAEADNKEAPACWPRSWTRASPAAVPGTRPF
ncbi:hypothetical protein J8F10_22610 [Gemmata sp. G18]|uniref:HEAT repeat domain-containing protein n=1 Tax=Gemmata palustris TaxID=2822762 RepID=A0ABS5BWE2_9BACT|nr:hypothetical protein [Gemmata palustris]MBP3958056.1 hypothetical protein [Gemmata palustris]